MDTATRRLQEFYGANMPAFDHPVDAAIKEVAEKFRDDEYGNFKRLLNIAKYHAYTGKFVLKCAVIGMDSAFNANERSVREYLGKYRLLKNSDDAMEVLDGLCKNTSYSPVWYNTSLMSLAARTLYISQRINISNEDNQPRLNMLFDNANTASVTLSDNGLLNVSVQVLGRLFYGSQEYNNVNLETAWEICVAASKNEVKELDEIEIRLIENTKADLEKEWSELSGLYKKLEDISTSERPLSHPEIKETIDKIGGLLKDINRKLDEIKRRIGENEITCKEPGDGEIDDGDQEI